MISLSKGGFLLRLCCHYYPALNMNHKTNKMTKQHSKTFHKIVAKYRHGEAKYSEIDKFIKSNCIIIELSTHLNMKRIKMRRRMQERRIDIAIATCETNQGM